MFVYIVYEERSVVTSFFFLMFFFLCCYFLPISNQTMPTVKVQVFWHNFSAFSELPMQLSILFTLSQNILQQKIWHTLWSISSHVPFKKLLFYFIKTPLCSGITPDGSLVTKLDTMIETVLVRYKAKFFLPGYHSNPLIPCCFFFMSFHILTRNPFFVYLWREILWLFRFTSNFLRFSGYVIACSCFLNTWFPLQLDLISGTIEIVFLISPHSAVSSCKAP